ncbi:acyltransferase [Methylosinus sp. H3A]|uniref:acyltransferase family protein n=1 Tax=Methylosinus sp. H3A TaxID=2785786 RepID=UPI0018C2A01D|nr:acyltransferase [Methylosinus sp. H3A]MBG0811852.1 acyltransferase [Methylosinus sp. H3A]
MSDTLQGSGDVLAYSSSTRVRAEATPTRLRLRELDGLRGWAAFSVLLFHSTWQIFGENFAILRNSSTAGLVDGPLDVSVFFVVSGAALSAPFFAGGGGEYILSAALRRYIRLTTPIVATVLLLILAERFGFARLAEARQFAPGLSAIAGETGLSFAQALKWSLSNVYTKPAEWGPVLPFLWTMPWEMVGSLALFLLLSCYPAMKRPERSIAIGASFLMLLFPYLAAFLFGALIGKAKFTGALNAPAPGRLGFLDSLAAKIAVAAALYVLAAWSMTAGAVAHVHVILAVAVVALALRSRGLSDFLAENALSRFLAKISFPLYLIHYVVIVTATSAAIAFVGDRLTLPLALAISAATILLSIVAAVLFQPIERFAHFASRRFAALVLG